MDVKTRVDLGRIHRMLEAAQPHANRINEVTTEADDLRTMSDEQMAVAALVYAVSLAKLTDLDLDQFIMLATITYDRADFARKEPNKPLVN